MATKKTQVDPEQQIEQALTKTELFFEKNGKKLLIVLLVIALGVGGVFGYDAFIAEPKSEKAADEMFEAQNLFAQDSFATALNGVNGVVLGFDAIISEYSGTAEANLAQHYAGICQMKQGKFNEAIAYFNNYKTTGGGAGEIIDAQNFGLVGDCYIELGDNAKGVESYKKAIAQSSSNATAPLYAHKAAIALYSEGRYAEALEMFQTIKGQYPRSTQARDADKFIALVMQKM